MGILRKAICGRTTQSLNRFSYFHNQFAGNVNGSSVASETNAQTNYLVHVAKSMLSGNVLPTTVRDYTTAAESNKFTYNRIMEVNPMIQQSPFHHALNVRSYSSSSSTSATAKTQPKEKSSMVLWHFHEGINEILADYVHNEVTRTWMLVFFRLSLIIVAKDVAVSLVF